MSRLRSRVERLERRNPDPNAEPVEIWSQDVAGTDRYTCSKHPGEVRTAADLGELPPPPDVLRVYILGLPKPAAGPW